MRRNSDVVLVVLGLALLVFVILLRLEWIYQLPYPTATDSYYYLEEFRSILLGGAGYYTDNETFFRVWGAVGRVFSLTPEQLYNLLVLSSLVFVSIALTLLFIGYHKYWLLPLVLTAQWSSDLLFYRHYAFPQQAFAVGCVLLGISLIVSNKRWSLIVGVLLAILGAKFHLFASGLALLIILALLSSRLSKTIVLILLALIAGVSLIAFSTLDSTPFQSLYESWPPGLVRACNFARCAESEWSEIITIFFAILCAIVCGWRKKIVDSQYWALWCVPLVLNILPWSDEIHLSYRLALATPWCVLWIAVYCSRFQIALPIYLLVLGSIFGWVLSRGEYPGPTLDPRVLSTHREALKSWIPEDAIIVAPHGIQYRVRYEIGRKSQHRFPETDAANEIFIIRPRARGVLRCKQIGAQISPRTQCITLSKDWVIERLR